jgi:hypothetical protein
MQGRLHKKEHNEWVVTYFSEMEDSSELTKEIALQLHPDDANELFELEQRFDFLEGRIAANPIVEFEIVNHQKLTGIVTYAKLKNGE